MWLQVQDPIQRPWMPVFMSLWVLCHTLAIGLWTNLLTFLGYICSSRSLYAASASFTHIVTLWYRYQDYWMLPTRLRSLDKNYNLQVKIRIID